jgi:RNA polymerase sigma factor (sigma-70 family)
MATDPASPDDDRDERVLRELARERARGPEGESAVRRFSDQLLRPYFGWARRVVAWQLDDPDLDDIANRILKRLDDAITNGLHKPLRNTAYDCIESEIKDFFKRRRKTKPEVAYDASQLPEHHPEDDAGKLMPGQFGAPPLADQAGAFRRIVEQLPERDRRIVTERLFIGRTPEEIAADLDMTRAALDTAYSRALTKLRKAMASGDVREPPPASGEET